MEINLENINKQITYDGTKKHVILIIMVCLAVVGMN